MAPTRFRGPRCIARAWRLFAYSAALLALLPSAARADVVAVGDVLPGELLDDEGPLQFGGSTDDTVIIGVGASDFSAGQMVIDIPEDTDPLNSPGGIIGMGPDAQGLVRIVGLNSAWVIRDAASGSGTSGDPNNTWSLVVGLDGQGFLDLVAGARVTPNGIDSATTMRITLGLNEGSQGFVSIDGFASIMKSRDLTVGDFGQGTLTLLNRGRLDTRRFAIIGQQRTSLNPNEKGSGYVVVDGQGTRWNVGDTSLSDPSLGDLTIGGFGRGTLEIRAGGWTRVSQDTFLGDELDSFGEAIVNGQNSTLWTFRNLVVGNDEAGGELFIQNKGLARADVFTEVGLLGYVTLANGTLLTPEVDNFGVIRGDGRIDTGIDGVVSNFGSIRNAAGVANIREKLVFTSPVDNFNAIESVGGEMEFQQPVVNDGEIVGLNAIYRFNGGLVNNGDLYFKNSLVWMPGAPVVSAASLSIDAGETTMMGNLSMTSSNTFNIEVGHTSTLLSVNGVVSLDGELFVTGADGYSRTEEGDGYFPGIGDAFEIISAFGITGVFDNINDPFSGVSFVADYSDPTRVVLNVVTGPVDNADFNNSGNVDSIDFLIWQRNRGATVPAGTLGDADGDGDVDGNDFNIWKAQFGGPPAAPVAGAVPEPSALVLALAALALPVWRKRR